MKLLLDPRPVRENSAFRRLWIGSSLSAFGSQFTTFAATWAVWRLTGSTVAVGALGLAGAVPWLVVALVGMAFIDSVDRARLARTVTIGQIVTSVALAGAAHLRSVAAILALVAVNASLSALGAPARRALIPGLVSGDRLAAALALNSLAFQASMLLGPAMAGLVTASTSVEICFLVDAASFVAALIGLGGLHVPPKKPGAARGVRAVLDGIGFAARRPVIRGALLSDLSATALAMPIALFPALNQERFGGTAATLGLFTTAMAVGGVVATALSGTVTHRSHPGLVMTLCAGTWGAALMLVAFATNLAVLLAALAIAGAADTWSVVSRGTLIQSATPDEQRGRISAIEQVVGIAGPNVGNFRAGAIAPLLGAGPAMAAGALTCMVASGLIYIVNPQLRRYRTPPGPAPAAP